MTDRHIMYVCTDCAEGNPEGCGHYDLNDLRVMPDGRWLCEICFDDADVAGDWGDFPFPPEYRPVVTPQDREAGR